MKQIFFLNRIFTFLLILCLIGCDESYDSSCNAADCGQGDILNEPVQQPIQQPIQQPVQQPIPQPIQQHDWIGEVNRMRERQIQDDYELQKKKFQGSSTGSCTRDYDLNGNPICH